MEGCSFCSRTSNQSNIVSLRDLDVVDNGRVIAFISIVDDVLPNSLLNLDWICEICYRTIIQFYHLKKSLVAASQNVVTTIEEDFDEPLALRIFQVDEEIPDEGSAVTNLENGDTIQDKANTCDVEEEDRVENEEPQRKKRGRRRKACATGPFQKQADRGNEIVVILSDLDETNEELEEVSRRKRGRPRKAVKYEAEEIELLPKKKRGRKPKTAATDSLLDTSSRDDELLVIATNQAEADEELEMLPKKKRGRPSKAFSDATDRVKSDNKPAILSSQKKRKRKRTISDAEPKVMPKELIPMRPKRSEVLEVLKDEKHADFIKKQDIESRMSSDFYICYICSKSLNSKLAFQYHLASQHILSTQFNHQKVLVAEKVKAGRRTSVIKGKKQESWVCDFCQKQYKSEPALRYHLKKHFSQNKSMKNLMNGSVKT